MNPVIRLIEHPLETLGDVGLLLFLVAALVLTFWAVSRNIMDVITDVERDNRTWGLLDAPLHIAARIAVVFALLALDSWLIGAVLYVI